MLYALCNLYDYDLIHFPINDTVSEMFCCLLFVSINLQHIFKRYEYDYLNLYVVTKVKYINFTQIILIINKTNYNISIG